MILWMILTVMVALAAVALTIPLVRRRDAAPVGNPTVDLLKAQLADIEAQVATGILAPDDAEGQRTEVRRRILAEGRAPDEASRPLSERNMVWLGFGVVFVVALAAVVLYARMGRPDLTKPSGSLEVASDHSHPGGGDVDAMIRQLETQLKSTPADPKGWGMLGWSYFQTGRFAQAATAYGHASALDDANAEYLSAEGEALVRSSGGQVTPAAQAAFRKAITVDPGDPRARYFMAVLKDQQGDRAGAMKDWIALLRTAPPDAPWVGEVRDFVERVAKDSGEDITARLPPAVASAAPAASAGAPPVGSPSNRFADAGQMSDAERQTMIAGMVGALAERLKTNPRDAEGWVRLMRSHMVLGQPGAAASDYRNAVKAFAGAPGKQMQLRDAARDLGVPGA